MAQVADDYAVPVDGPRTPQEFAGDINEILAAIASGNSGTSAPPNPVLGMRWYDTTLSPNIAIKIYDGADWLVEAWFHTVNNSFIHQIGGGGLPTMASATTTDLGSVFYGCLVISGTTAITSFGTGQYVGEVKFLTFSGILTLTHNATSLILPGGANISTTAGDVAIVQNIASGNWKVLAYVAAGSPLLAGQPTVASASTTNLGGVATQAVIVSGTTAITALGTVPTGVVKFVTFSGALILTHNGTSLILPNGANITTVAGDVAIFVSLGSGNWRMVNYFGAMIQLGSGVGTLASATTTNLGSISNPAISITGTTTITGFGSTAPAGTVKHVTFTGALILTHNGTSLILPNGVNITTVAGDSLLAVSLGSGNWRVFSYTYATQQIFREFQTIASATTTDLGSVAASAVTISGTTTITGFGSTAAVGAVKFIHFSGALTLTHNGTSLILHGGSNITTAAGDTAVFMHVSSGNWRCLAWTPAGATVETAIGTTASAGTTDLGASPRQSQNITGTTTITSFGSSAAIGSIRFLTFAGILQITYNATSMITPLGANITTAAGDSAIVQHLGSGNWKILVYQSGTAVSIADGSLTRAKLADATALSVIGRSANSSGVPADIAGTAGQALRISGASVLGFGAIDLTSSAAVTGQLLAASFPVLTGDVTTAGGALATTIANSAVTLAKMANLAQNTIIGRITASTGVPEALTAGNVRTIIGVGNAYNFNEASTAEILAGTASRVVSAANLDAAGAVSALTDGATITPDMNAARLFTLTIGGNRTLANPSNQRAGQSFAIVITQDGAGSRTLAYGSAWKFPGGAPTLSTAIGAVDMIVGVVQANGTIRANLLKALA